MGRNGRIAWGAGAFGLVALLVATIKLSGGSLVSAEAEAQRWAEDKALEVVVSGVGPEIVAKDVAGDDYRRLLVRIQAGILSEDQATTVRIWRIDGNLLFSTAQQDDVAEVTLPAEPSIERAVGGEVVSVLSDETTRVPGLRPAKQPLYQTFVPLQPSGATSVMGVVEIDQPYSSIHDPALRLWRLLQIVLAVALVGVVLGFARSAWQHAAIGARLTANPSAPGAARATREDRKRERARSIAARVWPRTRRAPAADHVPSSVPSPDVRAAESRMEELDLKVRAAEAEREQQVGEVKRLRDALEDKEAELAIAREGVSPRAEAKRERKVLAEAHTRAAEAERKATLADKKSEDAAKRAMEASTRALEIEAQLRSSEETIGALRKELATAHAELSRAQVERDGLADERSRLAAEVERIEAERAGLEAALAGSKADLVRSTTGLQTQIAAVGSDTGAALLEQRATTAEMQVADSDERVADAQGPLVRSEASLSEALEKLSELEQAREALSAELAQVKGVPVDDILALEQPADGVGGDDEVKVKVGGGSDPSAEQDDDEPPAGLSLRERLARAAAARHRGALS